MTPRVISKREVAFPRFEEDILSGKRTLAHTIATFHLIDPPNEADRKQYVVDDYNVGDFCLLYPKGSHASDQRVLAVITKADLVPFEVTENDCALLNVASVAEYIERWDRTHPNFVAVLRPIVWRIEWRYDAPYDEPRYRFSLATAVSEAADAVAIVMDRASRATKDSTGEK